MKSFWLEKNKCTGCGACANACPTDSITMKKDDCGFVYPTITESCIDCNLCQSVCNKRIEECQGEYSDQKVFAAWSLDSENRSYSTSGGLFYELSKKTILNGGVVAGAAYNNENLVEHICVFSLDDLKRVRQSKYLQSDINYVFRDLKAHLTNGLPVVFCGTPCQVAGLQAFLGKDYENLILLDLICRGANSPKAFKSWLSEKEKEENSTAKQVWFRNKVDGWKKSGWRTRVDYVNGKSKVYSQDDNLFIAGFLKSNMCIRPSCGACDFKGKNRCSDITLADFWGAPKEYDDDRGTSLVIINTKKGQALLEEMSKGLFLSEISFEDFERHNPCYGNSVNIPEKGEAFLRELSCDNFSEIYKKYQ